MMAVFISSKFGSSENGLALALLIGTSFIETGASGLLLFGIFKSKRTFMKMFCWVFGTMSMVNIALGIGLFV